MSQIYLEMNHIKKTFGELEVLKDISLSVHKGEVVSVIGPSGSGKSTLRCATMLKKWMVASFLFRRKGCVGRKRKMCLCK